MPDEEIPDGYTGRPHAELLAAGTVLWRVHRRTRAPQDFKPFDGAGAVGRFDATAEDPYSSMYAACRESTALAEVLLRSVPFQRREHRILGYESVWRRRLSPLVTQVELRLISLTSTRSLAAVCQDDWLIFSGPAAFQRTRAWARWLRTLDPAAHGVAWTTRRDLPEKSVLLFGDRCCGPDVLNPSELDARDLDTTSGLRWVNEMLRPYRASIEIPGLG